ncbi:hypothetical protein G6F56_010331 [Rhizopus delemar]|nr:hypothetical protein G6F56_010331 [Rhizopus delemar]
MNTDQGVSCQEMLFKELVTRKYNNIDEIRDAFVYTVKEETESSSHYVCSNGVNRPKPKRISKKKECSWSIFASCTKSDDNKWTVKMKNSNIDSHNHPIAIDKTIYHVYRKTNGDQQVTITQMLKSHKYLHLPSSTDEMQKLLDFFAGNNYIVRYKENPVTKELKELQFRNCGDIFEKTLHLQSLAESTIEDSNRRIQSNSDYANEKIHFFA